jgi:fumarate hydratase class II
VRAIGLIKAEAARVNGLDPAVAEAADEVAAGRHDAHFPIDAFQTGSGTSSNMNANEVIAHIASSRLATPVHPNDDVNRSQSSNDVFPSAVHLAAATAIVTDLIPSARHLADVLLEKAGEFARVVKSGRTHLMDATPVTLGQEFGGYAAQIDDGIARVEDALRRLCALPLGGTAVGTGINAPPGFAGEVIARLAQRTGLPLTEARDHFAAQGARDALVETSGQVRTLAVSLIKISNDLRWMGSGPRTGLAEIRLPDLQPGSSIMPGKVNPVIPEVVTQIGAQVTGTMSPSRSPDRRAPSLVFIPVMAQLLESISLPGVERAADKCVVGIEANVDRLKAAAESSLIGTKLRRTWVTRRPPRSPGS